MSSEDHDDEEVGYQSPEEVLSNEAQIYRIRFSAAKHVEVEFCKKEDTNKKRHPPSRSGNNPARVKRVLSCKRKTHRHLTVSSGARRKSLSSGKLLDTGGSGSSSSSSRDEYDQEDMQELTNRDCWEGSEQRDLGPKMKEEEISKYGDFFKELSKDHRMMTQVLSGRHLRLKIASSLWKRSTGELLAYLLRLQDTSLLVDCLPVITKRLQGDTTDINIGFCSELLPLVKSALRSPFEDYLIVGLSWVQSVLNKWWPQFTGHYNQACDTYLSDRNIDVIKYQLQDLKEQASHFCSFSRNTGKMAKSVQACLFQLP